MRPDRGHVYVRSRWLLAAGLLGSLTLLLAACTGAGRQDGGSGASGGTPGAAPGATFMGEEIVPPVPAPAFDLTDQEGRRTKLADYKGRYVLLTFAYTGCPDICPGLAQSFRKVEQAYGQDVDRKISFVIISLDPEGDTQEKAKRWTEAFGGSWRYLIGSRTDLEKVWDSYGMVAQKASDGSVEHAVKTFVIDPNGLIRLRYGGLGWDTSAVNDLKKLMGQ